MKSTVIAGLGIETPSYHESYINTLCPVIVSYFGVNKLFPRYLREKVYSDITCSTNNFQIRSLRYFRHQSYSQRYMRIKLINIHTTYIDIYLMITNHVHLLNTRHL
jgi:hypothetical protein